MLRHHVFGVDFPQPQTYLSDMEITDYIEEWRNHGKAPSAATMKSLIQQCKAQLDELTAMETHAIKRTTVKCPHCEKRSQVGNVEVIDVYRYIPSYNSYEDPSSILDRTVAHCPKCEGQFVVHTYTGKEHRKWDEYPLKEYYKKRHQIEERR